MGTLFLGYTDLSRSLSAEFGWLRALFAGVFWGGRGCLRDKSSRIYGSSGLHGSPTLNLGSMGPLFLGALLWYNDLSGSSCLWNLGGRWPASEVRAMVKVRWLGWPTNLRSVFGCEPPYRYPTTSTKRWGGFNRRLAGRGVSATNATVHTNATMNLYACTKKGVGSLKGGGRGVALAGIPGRCRTEIWV